MTRSRSLASASSQQVVAINTRALLDTQNHGHRVKLRTDDVLYTSRTTETAGGRTIGANVIKSLMPRGAALNSAVSEYQVTGLHEDEADANQSQNETRLRQDRPTADMVKRSSYKTGAKLLIKIEPTNAKIKEEIKKYVPQMVFDTFSLQSIAEPDSERYQIMETFEDEVVFLFGRRPRVWTMQGIVLNGKGSPLIPEGLVGPESPEEKRLRLSRDHDWANRLIQDWDDFYRGSKAVELQARTFITYDDSVLEATLLELTMVRNAQIPSAVNTTMTFVVHQRAFVGQEYRDGLTAPNLADLIAKTNSGKSFDEMDWAPEIDTPPPSIDELRRQRAVVEDELVEAQEDVRAAVREKDAVEEVTKTTAQEIDEYNQEAEAARQRQAEAQAVIDDPDATAEEKAVAQEDFDRAFEDANDAESNSIDAQSRLLAAQAQSETVTTNLDETAAVEEDYSSHADVLAMAIERSGAVAVSSDLTEEDVIRELEEDPDLNNVRDVTFVDTDRGTFVEFTADYDSAEMGSGMVTVRQLT